MNRGLALVLLMAAAAVGYADTIATSPLPPTHLLSGFGSSEVYRGNTFRLPPGSPVMIAESLSVYVGPGNSGAFRVLVTGVDTSSGFHPTDVLFESAIFQVPSYLFSNKEFEMDLGGLILESDREYAWILDYFSAGEPTPSVGYDTGLGSYDRGYGFRFVNGPSWPGGTREDHFASGTWFLETDRDFAFQLDYITVSGVPNRVGLSIVSNEAAAVCWYPLIDRQYQVEYSDDACAWSPVGEPLFSPGTLLTVLDPIASSESRLYRLNSSGVFNIDAYRLGLHTVGNTWTYNVTDNDNGNVFSYVLTEEAIGAGIKNGHQVVIIEERSNQVWIGEDYYLTDATNGLFYVGGKDLDGSESYYTPPLAEFYSSFVPGTAVTQLAHHTERGMVTASVSQAVSPVAVVVTAGTYPISLQVDARLWYSLLGYPVLIEGSDWQVQDIGVVKAHYEAAVPDLGLFYSTDLDLISFTP